jgi:hypothetical protein
VLVVPKDLLGRPHIAHGESGTMPGNLIEVIRKTMRGTRATESREPFPQGLRDRFRLGFAREFGDCGRQLFSFAVSNIQGHGFHYI